MYFCIIKVILEVNFESFRLFCATRYSGSANSEKKYRGSAHGNLENAVSGSANSDVENSNSEGPNRHGATNGTAINTAFSTPSRRNSDCGIGSYNSDAVDSYQGSVSASRRSSVASIGGTPEPLITEI
jgi:hypothetical protein